MHHRLGRALAPFLAILAVATFVGAPGVLLAQPDSVRITLFRPPPNQLKIADLWRIRLENRTSRPQRVYLYGRVDEAKDGLILEATSGPITLQPGPRVLTGNDVGDIDATYHNNRYKEIFLRTGSAPTGDYTVCVTVRAVADDSELGTDCYDQRVEVMQPPILVQPLDGSRVEEKTPVFTWLPPAPIQRGSRVQYTLRIVEMIGRQSPYDAMTSNPPFLERSGLTTPLLPFPIGARALRSGARYAWQVRAADGSFPMGESEIWSFVYQPAPLIGEDGRGDGRLPGSGVRLPGGSGGSSDIDTGRTVIVRRKLPFRRGIQGVDLEIGPMLERPIEIIARPLDLAIPPTLLQQLLSGCE